MAIGLRTEKAIRKVLAIHRSTYNSFHRRSRVGVSILQPVNKKYITLMFHEIDVDESNSAVTQRELARFTLQSLIAKRGPRRKKSK